MELILAILAGVLLWSGFAPIDFWPGPLLGLALLYRLMASDSRRYRLLLAGIVGFLFFAPLLHWSGIYVGAFPWLALATLQSALFSLIGWFQRAPYRFAAGFSLIELLRMKAPFGGFGWGRVGFTQTDSISWIYPIIGVTGVTFFCTAVAVAIAVRSWRSILVITLICIAGLAAPSPVVTDTVKVTAVQGGVDRLGLDFNERALSVFNRHIKATQNYQRSELIIWPENASDIDPVRNPVARDLLAQLISDIDRPILVGAVQQSANGPENVSLLYGADGVIKSRYQKQDLAPFGEYIPLRALAEWTTAQARSVRDFVPGRSWVTHTVNGKNFISAICFEVLDDDLLKAGAASVDFLVSQTNNATFGTSAQAAQQLQIIQARAAELGRDTAVVSTTGFTAQINSEGAILRQLPQFETGSLEMTLRTHQGETIASKLRSWHWLIFLVLFRVIREFKKNR